MRPISDNVFIRPITSKEPDLESIVDTFTVKTSTITTTCDEMRTNSREIIVSSEDMKIAYLAELPETKEDKI